MKTKGPAVFPRLLLALTLTAVAAATAPAIDLPGVAPGPAKATLDGPQLAMENAVLQARWDLSPGSRRLVEVIDRVADAGLVCDSRLFSVKLADGSELASAALCPAGQATLERITPRPTATRLAERSAGWRATLELATADGRTRFRWQAVLRDGSNYVRQEVALLAHAGPRPVEFGLLDLPAGDARSCGAVDGSPLVSGNFFLGCEQPLAKNQVAAGRAVCRLPLYDSPAAGMAEASAAVGVAPAGQLRRGFLYYLDREPRHVSSRRLRVSLRLPRFRCRGGRRLRPGKEPPSDHRLGAFPPQDVEVDPIKRRNTSCATCCFHFSRFCWRPNFGRRSFRC